MEKSIIYEAWKKGAVSVGMGYKLAGGVIIPEKAVVFGVPVKKERQLVAKSQLIEPSYDGYVSDVVQTGIIRAFQNTGRMRPALGGCSIGHHAISAGTLGCVVWQDDRRLILSNNHVLANSNNAKVGDAILQPGPFDDGTANDKIAELYDYVEIRFMDEDSTCFFSNQLVGGGNFVYGKLAPNKPKTRFKAVAHTRIEDAVFNLVDAALAFPVNQADVSSEILDIGHVFGTVGGRLGMSVRKSGRTTGLTAGEIDQVDVVCQVQYDGGKVAVFEDQLLAGPMSKAGDSGSLVVDTDNRAVGLLFAGSNSVTIINRIENVCDALGVAV